MAWVAVALWFLSFRPVQPFGHPLPSTQTAGSGGDPVLQSPLAALLQALPPKTMSALALPQ